MIFGEGLSFRKKILLVEDNFGDAKIVSKVLNEGPINLEIRHIADGGDAFEWLVESAESHVERLPDIVLLDLNLPRRSGLDILKLIKGNERMKHIPVVVLTSSDSDLDVRVSFRASANAYLQKAVDLHDFFETLRVFRKFWIESARLPGPSQ